MFRVVPETPGCTRRKRGALYRRHFFLIAAVCALVLMVVVGGLKLATMGHGKKGGTSAVAAGKAGARPVEVSQTFATIRPFADRIDVLGVAKGRQSVTITSNTTELITAVHFSDGQRVRAGQVLVDLKAQEQTADIAQQQAALALAQSNYARWRTLYEKGIAAAASLDQYKAALNQAKANLAAAVSRKGDRTIRAPFSGVVGLSDIAPGALINPGTPIVSLDDLSVIRVDFQVPDRFLANLHEGTPITARTEALPDVGFSGRISKIDTRVDERTRAIRARAEFANPGGRIKPGMLMHVTVDQGLRQAVAAPEAAIQYDADQASVFVIARQGGRTVAVQRPVATGANEGGFIEIKQGLAAGVAIVADGVNRVKNNQPVMVAGQRNGGMGAKTAAAP
jgi:membrane fusion protein (multidrug efflux system)